MIAGKYVDPADTYEDFATEVARHLGKYGVMGGADSLCNTLPAIYNFRCEQELLESIQADPQRFYERVQANLYAIAMEAIAA
jgi:hypothetical protein